MSKKTDYDIGGWATRNDLLCSDGRVIRRDAFKDCDGKRVPMVWSHIHNDPEMVLGHADLFNMPEGVYMKGKFNNSDKGRQTKLLVEHGDVVGLSIWANQLKQSGGDVLHGDIKEVSVVLAGANPGAYIDSVILAHGDESMEETDAVIVSGEPIDILHSDDDTSEDVIEHAEKKEEESEETEEVVETKETKETKEKKTDESEEDDESKGEPEMAEKKEVNPNPAEEDDDETIEDVFNTLSEKQKNVVYAIIGEALNSKDSDENDEDEEEKEMKHNVFDAQNANNNYLSHDDMATIFSDAKKMGSLKDAVAYHEEEGVLAHAVYDADNNEVTYGMANVGYLFPDARTVNNTPEFIKRDDGWVSEVINSTHHTPFSRVKSLFANITNDEARARGYIKGHQKANEVFSLLKREATPQTIYKKQKMDRDDILDITDFDVVAWLRGEMRLMLNEEIARAVLIGDGREPSDDDHIKETCVIPIATDESLYTIQGLVTVGNSTEDTAKNMIKAAIRARKDYKGTGSPVMFTSETWLTEMMLLEDGLGHPLYADEAALARRLRVSKIIPCPVMENYTINDKVVYGIIVNLADYNIGADKGGEVNMFDDFDIDYNQQKYLIETRISGALVRPYSAIVLVERPANNGNDNG